MRKIKLNTTYAFVDASNIILASQGQTLRSYSEKQPCSYPEYIGKRKSAWVHPEEILSYFDRTSPNFSYENFIKQNDGNELLQKLILEED